jgi:hypothetical protein
MSAAAAVAAGQPLVVSNFAEWRDAARDLLIHAVPPGSSRHLCAACRPQRYRRR